MTYKIQRLYRYGWDDGGFTDANDNQAEFLSRAEAQACLDGYLKAHPGTSRPEIYRIVAVCIHE
jgi:hypothetical protein